MGRSSQRSGICDKSESDAVGFQYWYGANGEDEETYEPIKIESVNLTGASCTYTRTMTVPYNKTITKTSNKSHIRKRCNKSDKAFYC